MKLRFAAVALFVLSASPSFAQVPMQGVAINKSTVNSSVTITAGSTFQQALASIVGSSKQRQSLTVQNNNTSTDNCWVFFGATASATKAASILLSPGQAVTRYWPYVPSDAVQVTCASTSDTVYVENN